MAVDQHDVVSGEGAGLRHASLLHHIALPQAVPALLQHLHTRSGQVRLGQVRSGQVRSGKVRYGKVRSGQVRSGKVRYGKVR